MRLMRRESWLSIASTVRQPVLFSFEEAFREIGYQIFLHDDAEIDRYYNRDVGKKELSFCPEPKGVSVATKSYSICT